MTGSFRIAEWVVNPDLGTLTRVDERLRLEPQTMQVLVYLAEHAGALVTREDLFRSVWNETIVTDGALTYCVHSLRKALGDTAKEPQFIQTIVKKGYRLIAPVWMDVDEPALETGPYLGLTPFSEEHAEYFFGREVEVELLREKVHRNSMLALVGPSGVGKSSLIRAGLLPSLARGWRAIVCVPGERPFLRLAQALVTELSTDTEALKKLIQFEENVEISVLERWRRAHDDVLLVVDQFEELFTLNPNDVQRRFAELVGRAAEDLGIHVLLVLRDDFLLHCHRYEPLAPVFQDLTPLGPPSAEAMHRALLEPARNSGYVFEDETLPLEMVAAVGEERAALPLLAFAAARLWEKRDPDRKLLTRKAYENIGGVGGALAQHAETTLAAIGDQRHDMAREIFRNLVTGQGTRASRDKDDLMSVFPDREDASKVLQALIDARLLTSYELPSREGEASAHLIEIVHESLLKHWPRLVRWQTQDSDSARLRDQLRQAAQLWEERDRPPDLLWTGMTFREFQLWRDRYPGGLSDVEETYAQAMVSRAERTKRRRRNGLAAVIATLLMGLTIVASLWRHSEQAREQAEAAELLSLGRLQLQAHPTAALAYALASLERSDNEPARRFALEALWQGPLVSVAPDPFSINAIVPSWSPDGRWLAAGGTGGLLLYDRDGGNPRLLSTAGWLNPEGFSKDGSRLVTENSTGQASIWALPEGQESRSWTLPPFVIFSVLDRRILTIEREHPDEPEGPLVVRERPVQEDEARVLGRWRGSTTVDFDPRGEWLVSIEDGRLLKWRAASLDERPQSLGRHDGNVSLRVRPWTDRIVTADAQGQVRIWNAETGRLERSLRSPADARWVELDPSGRYVAAAPSEGGLPSRTFHVFDLEGPSGQSPIALLNDDIQWLNGMEFHPRKPILASGNYPRGVLLWNLSTPRATVLRGQRGPRIFVAFTPDGRLLSTSSEGVVRLWPLWTDPDGDPQELWVANETKNLGNPLAISKDGRFVVVDDMWRSGQVWVPLDGRPGVVHDFGGEFSAGETARVSLSPDGRLLATSYLAWNRPEAATLLLQNLQTGEVRALRPDDAGDRCVINSSGIGLIEAPYWLPNGRLISDGATGLRLWNLSTGTSRKLRPCRDARVPPWLGATPDSRTILTLDGGEALEPNETSTLVAFDLETSVTREIVWHGNQVSAFALDPTGTVLVTGSGDGVVRVGPLSGGPPHLLYGHDRLVRSVAVSPDGKWIASASDDDTIRLWPMPDVASPPLHTLRYEELLAKLRAFTNLRVISDPDSTTGYALKPGAFRGWDAMPNGW